MKEIALFGTSADPPTAGHQAILRWLSDRYDWVAVWAANNPYKHHRTSLDDRLTMLHLAIAHIKAPCHNISLHRELSHTRTIETVRKARELWGNEVNFTLVVGADLIRQMPRWYQAEALLKEVELLIMPRLGYNLDREEINILEKMGGRCWLADFLPPPVSSTAYRDRGDISVLSPQVRDYIEQQRLYAS